MTTTKSVSRMTPAMVRALAVIRKHLASGGTLHRAHSMGSFQSEHWYMWSDDEGALPALPRSDVLQRLRDAKAIIPRRAHRIGDTATEYVCAPTVDGAVEKGGQ
jgi:hypothetical protein